ncbi:MAG: DUF4091 domain-containing protein [Acidobacteriia bacterium]|nr:DUF4091 domain-containing protein [Terriglobia bacterium]
MVGSHTKNTPPEELVGESPGWFPDPLLDFPIDVKANHTQSFWISVAVPGDAAPGVYRGAVTVRAGTRNLARAGFVVRVVAATVPEARTLKVTNWFNLSDKATRQFYNAAIFSPDWWTLVENLARVMAEHRQNVIITPLMELIVPSVEGGELRYDFANFDRWVETFRKAGAMDYIEGGHVLGRGREGYNGALQVDIFQAANGQVQTLAVPADDPRAESFLAGFLSALNTHLEAKGWKGFYLQHILDEAHGTEPPVYARYAAMVRRYLPGVRTMDAVDAEHMPDELRQNCDVWVPQLGLFDDQMDLLNARMKGGHEVWFYTCLFPNKRYLNRLIDYPLLKVRLLHWLNFRYGFTGFLHWGWNYWSPEPTNDTQPVIDNNTELLPPGDAFIVYPDPAHKSVYSSIRLEAMREGIEDYELLRVLKEKNPAEADRLANQAIRSFTDYVRDVPGFRSIERQLLEALSRRQ